MVNFRGSIVAHPPQLKVLEQLSMENIPVSLVVGSSKTRPFKKSVTMLFKFSSAIMHVTSNGAGSLEPPRKKCRTFIPKGQSLAECLNFGVYGFL